MGRLTNYWALASALLVTAPLGCDKEGKPETTVESRTTPGLEPRSLETVCADHDVADVNDPVDFSNMPNQVIDGDLTISRDSKEIPVYQVVAPFDVPITDHVKGIARLSYPVGLTDWFGENWPNLLSSYVVALPVELHVARTDECKTSMHANILIATPEACVFLDDSDELAPNSGVIHEGISHAIFDRLVLGGSPYSFSEGLALLGSSQSSGGGDKTFTHPYFNLAGQSTDGLTHNTGEQSIQLWHTLATQYGLDFPVLPLISERVIQETERLGHPVPFPVMVSILEDVSKDVTGTKPDLESVLREHGVDESYFYPINGESAYHVLRKARVDTERGDLVVGMTHVLSDPLYMLFNVYLAQNGEQKRLNSIPVRGLVEPGDVRWINLALPDHFKYADSAKVSVEILDVNEKPLYQADGTLAVIEREIDVPVRAPDLEVRSVFNYLDGSQINAYVCNNGGHKSTSAYAHGVITMPNGDQIDFESSVEDLTHGNCTTTKLAEMVQSSELGVDVCVVAPNDYNQRDNCVSLSAYNMKP